MRFEIDDSFIHEASIPLAGADLAYGLREGFLKATEAIKVATRQARQGVKDPTLVALSELLLQQDEEAERFLAHVTIDTDRSERKWLYLHLRAAYQMCAHDEELADALIDRLYADFDYPEVMAPLVGWSGKPTEVASLSVTWRAVLEDLRHQIRARDHGAGR